MKRYLLILILAVALLLTACGQVPAETSGQTDAPRPPLDGCAHTDDDNDGACDACAGNVLSSIDFYAVNDLHGKFDDTDAQPGVDELTTYLKNEAKVNDHTVLLASGDMWQGSSESNLTKGHLVTDWMNELGFAAMTLGNHEYDWGEECIESNAQAAMFPILAINVFDRETNARVEYCEPSVMVERGDITIGIIGAIGDCYSSISGEHVEDVYFKTGNELTALVKAESERLRAAGADLIVYSLHDGHGNSATYEGATLSGAQIKSYYDISLSDGYVDLVFEGHSHQRYVFKDPEGVYHLQGGGDNKGISHATVNVNIANGNVSVGEAEFVPTSVYTDLADDPLVDGLLARYHEEISKGSEPLGTNDKQRSGDELRALIAELYLEAGLARWGEEYNIVLGGGFISVRSPYSLGMGAVTYADLQMLFPFDNQLVLCSIKGTDLISKFIQTQNENYFIALSEYGEDIQDSIKPNDTYYIVIDTYSSGYGPNRVTEVARYDEGVFARDLLADYIKAGNMTKPLPPFALTSIPEVLAIGDALAPGAETDGVYYVRGRIKSIASTTWGNMTIEDEDGNSVYIYGLYDKNGTRYDAIGDPPRVGDTITVMAPIKKFVNGQNVIVELTGAKLYEE